MALTNSIPRLKPRKNAHLRRPTAPLHLSQGEPKRAFRVNVFVINNLALWSRQHRSYQPTLTYILSTYSGSARTLISGAQTGCSTKTHPKPKQNVIDTESARYERREVLTAGLVGRHWTVARAAAQARVAGPAPTPHTHIHSHTAGVIEHVFV